MNDLKKFAAVLSAALIPLSLAGCSDSSDDASSGGGIVYYDSSNSYVDSAAERAKADQEARASAKKVEGKLGEEAVVCDCGITFKRAVRVGVRKGDDGSSSDSDMIAIEAEFKNNTAETVTASALGDAMVSVDEGNPIPCMDVTADVTAKHAIDGYRTLNEEVDAGGTTDGYLTFCAPVGWKELKITYVPHAGDNSYDNVEYTITADMVEDA